jgi:hypothetical protein
VRIIWRCLCAALPITAIYLLYFFKILSYLSCFWAFLGKGSSKTRGASKKEKETNVKKEQTGQKTTDRLLFLYLFYGIYDRFSQRNVQKQQKDFFSEFKKTYQKPITKKLRNK